MVPLYPRERLSITTRERQIVMKYNTFPILCCVHLRFPKLKYKLGRYVKKDCPRIKKYIRLTFRVRHT
jgi:hypothetical protein